jgi:hypothetical protein
MNRRPEIVEVLCGFPGVKVQAEKVRNIPGVRGSHSVGEGIGCSGDQCVFPWNW